MPAKGCKQCHDDSFSCLSAVLAAACGGRCGDPPGGRSSVDVSLQLDWYPN
jgi:hypothetical protein